MRTIRFDSGARDDLDEALEFYRARREGLDRELLEEVHATLAEAARNPERFPLVSSICRKAVLRRFPFLLLFKVIGDSIVVGGVHHTSRRPRAW